MNELIRWIIDPTEPSYAEQVRLLRDLVIPIRRSIPQQSYLSRQGSRVWLTVLAPAAECTRLEEQVRFDGFEFMPERKRQDPLLVPGVEEYCRDLADATSLAADLLEAPDFAAHQRYFTLAACWDFKPVPFLEAYMHAHTATHRGWSEERRSGFWVRFGEPGPSPGLSHPGHWIWNILVGPHPRVGEAPHPIMASIGALLDPG